MTYEEKANAIASIANTQSEAYQKGRVDAFREIAYYYHVKKEPFEILSYEKGARDFVEWLSRKYGINTCARLINGNLAYEELDVEEVIKQWKKDNLLYKVEKTMCD